MPKNIKRFYYNDLNLFLSLVVDPRKNINQGKDALVEEIMDLVNLSWGNYEREKIENVFLNLDQIILGRIDGELCFITGGKWENISYQINKIPVFRIGLTVVRKFNKKGEYLWKKGIMSRGTSALLKNIILKKLFTYFYIAFRTIEPATYQSIIGNLEYVLPDYRNYIHPNDKEKSIAFQISEIISHGCKFDVEKFVTRDAFRANLKLAQDKFNEIEQFTNKEIRDFFKTNLDYGRGDAFIILARASFFYFLKSWFKNFLIKIFN